ncbi:preprotein translocase subunit YajC [Novosphingobium sp. SG751A]|uniref:Sec translocon accessory complex subunit YajC n=1 Tax=Novosphingobium humi TaxID=2282397 RepID=A0ABY7TRZ0_9SPHN|nr:MULTISPECIES: preprotein translocase subunit YajC [Novosphingobium]NOW46940.1 preprotein translocase subunit YajC [Novosphingobium sp. SG751A]MDR6708421.1 preprotein translocase subunit YajC [Novosphingobium sp. 1748]ODU81135.1 MAG: preprotein translocase subunit YajC [Novosphingobium sp. SCN 63-17]OJX94946.1 MAG: preprotein translocase subunit YajC [Novosphingobium sp. 63-713]WCT75965.1 preprotein translocase subunit YajC [Novosphingobium humi]
MSIQTLSLLSAAAAGGQPPAWLQFLPLVLMGIVMWFLFLRPQMAQQKAQKAKLEGIKKNDMVITAGGLLAKVVKADDDYLELEIAPNTRVRAVRATISDVVVPGTGKPAND